MLGMSVTSAPLTALRCAVSLLHFTVAIATARRAPLVRMGSPRALLSALPALIVAGVAFRLAAPLESWPTSIEVVFLLGAALAIVTFISMGESFAVLPARRRIVSTGPYRIVRHPAYAGELLMIAACAASNPSAASALVLVGALPLVALRIRAEETLLSQSDAYRSYRAKVPFRVIPCLW
jgi:protein-S-isoprenylcysteine O-methyltransferase Ste14